MVSMTFDPIGEPHSAAHFDAQRDFWWNRDFLELLAARFELRDVHAALDVGAGIGHSGMVLLGLLAPDVTLTSVERDPRWVTRARERAADAGIANHCEYVVGVAEALPFPDASFDLVTCQTLLIHVADVPAVRRGQRFGRGSPARRLGAIRAAGDPDVRQRHDVYARAAVRLAGAAGAARHDAQGR
jgi:SAM-dependent methyltransferase